METRWLYRTSGDFCELREAAKGVCVIPMGCVEKHGLHDPLGLDILKISHLVYEASKLETVCVFPDFTFGDLPGLYLPDGTVSIPLETQMLLLEQLCDSIARNGFHKILIADGHGGNKFWLSAFLRNIKNKHHDFELAVTRTPLGAPSSLAEILLEKGPGSVPELTPEDEAIVLKYHELKPLDGHAGWKETSYMMGICPESVHLDRLGVESGLNTHVADYLKENGISVVSDGWGYNYPNSYSGEDPVECNERIGRAAVRVGAEVLAKRFKVFKDDENLWKWRREREQRYMAEIAKRK